MLPSFATEAATVIRAPLAEMRGSQVRDWDAAESHAVAGCSVQPGSTSREFGGRAEQVSDGLVLYAPPGSDIREGDRIAWGGTVYEMDGAPQEWRSPKGRASHVQCRLVEWKG